MVVYHARAMDKNAEILCRKSWTGHAMNLAGLGIGLFVADAVSTISEPAGAGAVVLSFAAALYRHQELRNACLYIDEDGVWEFGGILPWSKGVRGVNWRDLDEAAYVTGFWGWLFGSYRVVIRHRYKQGDEIALEGMHRGDRAASAINKMHLAMLRAAGAANNRGS